MKALLLMPKKYSLAAMLKNGFQQCGWSADIIDESDIISEKASFIYNKTIGLPEKIIKSYKQYYYRLLNTEYIKVFESLKPDLVMIYNNQFVFPNTISKFKEKAKIAFILGDNPLYSDTFEYNIEILEYSDYTICPDSYWKEQLERIDINNLHHDFIGYDKNVFFKMPVVPKKYFDFYKSNALFIGRAYKGASGYKRAKFYDSIQMDNFKLFGNKEWVPLIKKFPNLESKFYLQDVRITDSELNYALNSTKICPIEQNKGIINGIHLRVFESIGSGSLPIVEWRKDIKTIFEGKIPLINSSQEMNEQIEYYLNHNHEREQLVEYLTYFINERFTPILFIKRVQNSLFS